MRTEYGTRLQPVKFIGRGHILVDIISKVGGRTMVSTDAVIPETESDHEFLKSYVADAKTPPTDRKTVVVEKPISTDDPVTVDVIPDVEIVDLLNKSANIVKERLAKSFIPATV